MCVGRVSVGRLKEIRIASLADFAKNVEKLLGKSSPDSTTDNPFAGNWYRGVGNAKSFVLKPGLYRHPRLTAVEELLKLEAKMLQDFKRQSILHTDALGGEGQDAEFRMLFYMQHHGVPTRLLDWTTNPFIALYFALTTAELNAEGLYAEDAAVWVLNPTTWNKTSLSQISHGNKGPLLYSEAMQNYGPRKLFSGDFEPTAIKTLYDHPACILALANNARMFAQRGVFTIFGRSLDSLETQFRKAEFPSSALAKLVVPREKIGELMQLLLRLGYTDSVSYPDVHGLAMEIRRTRGFTV
jgi:FRG domain